MRHTIRTPLVALLVGLSLWAMILTAGCSAESEAPETETAPAAVEPAESAGEDAPEADGLEVVEGACAQCHDATRIYLLQTEMPDWEAIVSRMTQEHGAVLTAEEQAAVVEYLENQ